MRRVGPYEVLEELGRGGVGAVFRARRPGSGRDVALKLLLSPLADADERARFEREARVLQGVHHPGIIEIEDAGVSDDRLPYLALALMPGGSLRDRLRREGRLESRHAAELTRKLAIALEYAHRQGVLHRDLKPHNVLFDAEGEPVLTDFGLARVSNWERLTATGEILGTPAFMSPEQAQGEQERIGPASDVYGMGATLYAMLSGEPPFRGSSSLAVLDQLLNEAPAPLPSAVDPALRAICFKCLAKAPQERYPSAASLGEALSEWQARPTPGSASASSASSSSLAWLAPVGAGLAAAAVGLALALRPGPVASESGGVAQVDSAAAEAPIRKTQAPEPEKTPAAKGADAKTPPKERQARAIELLREFARARAAKNWVEALMRADEAVRTLYGAPTLRARALAKWDLGSREEAVLDMIAAVEISPTWRSGRLDLVGMLQTLGDEPGMTRELFRVWELDRQALDHEHRAALIAGLGKAGRWADALSVIEAVVRARPGELSVRILRVSALWSLWKRQEAIRVLREVLGGTPAGERKQMARTRLAQLERDLAESKRRADGVGKVRAIRRKAEGLIDRRAWAEAARVIESGLAVLRTPALLRLASTCAAQRGRTKSSLKLAKEAMRFAWTREGAGEAAWFAARVCLMEGQGTSAQRYLSRAIDLGGPAVALSHRGSIYLSRGWWEEAFVDFRRALKRKPDDPTALVGLGWEHFVRGRYEAALASFERAARGMPAGQRLPADEGRGAVLVRLKRYDEARPVLDHVLKERPGQFRARFARAEMRWALRDEAGAIADQRAGLDRLKATHPRRPRALKQLKQMGFRR